MRDYNPPNPYSFGDTVKMSKMITKEKEELKKEEIKKDESNRTELRNSNTN
jgi:hypothetical protein